MKLYCIVYYPQPTQSKVIENTRTAAQ